MNFNSSQMMKLLSASRHETCKFDFPTVTQYLRLTYESKSTQNLMDYKGLRSNLCKPLKTSFNIDELMHVGGYIEGWEC